MKHTATPWSIHKKLRSNGTIPSEGDKPEWNYGSVSIGHGDTIIADVAFHTLAAKYSGYPKPDTAEEMEANARFIVQAVNLHEELVAALEGMLAKDAAMREHFGHKWPIDLDHNNRHARTALARAKGEGV